MRAVVAVGIAALLGGGCSAHSSDRAAKAEFAAYRPLVPFFDKLAHLRAGRGAHVAVLQVGDSHTANDAFSGRMRELMQARFGDAGRGLLPPGIPFQYYRPAVVTVTADGWTPLHSGHDPGPFGFAGIRQQTGANSTMTLTAPPPDLTRVSVEVLAQPGGGTLDITTSDGRTASVATAGGKPGMMRIEVPSGPATASLELRARPNGPVDMLAWTAERDGPGVTWSNLGTIGATVELVNGWDPRTLREEAAQLRPGLIVIAFGTNEGFKNSTDLAAYPALFRSAIRTLRRAAPGAAILVAGPLDGVRAAGSGPGLDCPGQDAQRWAIPPICPNPRDRTRGRR